MASNLLLVALGLFLLWLAVTGRLKNIAAAEQALATGPNQVPSPSTSGTQMNPVPVSGYLTGAS